MAEKLLVLQLGSNLGNRFDNLQKACGMIIDSIGPIEAVSSIYESTPWGYDSKNTFFNQCLLVWSDMDPDRILNCIHQMEEKLGRMERTDVYVDRLIDIDILFYGDMILSRPDLQIPHGKIQDRRFSLVPMAELLPDFEHPVFRKKISTLLSECVDKGLVTRIGAY